MFKAITWGQFLGFVSVLLLLYYTYLALTYYRAEIMGLLKGQGKAAGPALAPTPAAGSIVGRGSLIPRSVAVPATAQPQQAAPAPASGKATEPGQAEGASQAEAATERGVADGSAAEELPDLDLPAADLTENNVEIVNHNAIDVDNKHSFAERNETNPFQGFSNGSKPAVEEFEPGVTFGIAQLGNYLERVSEGQITQQELIEQEPGLADTDLMMAFFQASTKGAQRAASHLYAGIAEPTLG